MKTMLKEEKDGVMIKKTWSLMTGNTYVVSPKRNRTFEIARQCAGAGRLRRWCCVAGTLSFIFTLATSRHFN
jgi:hypothetical protein